MAGGSHSTVRLTRWRHGRAEGLGASPPITRLFLERNGSAPPLTVKEGREKLWALAHGAGRGLTPASEAGVRPLPPPPPEKTRWKKKTRSAHKPSLLRVEDLWHVYPDGTEALRGIDMEISAGEFVALIGRTAPARPRW